MASSLGATDKKWITAFGIDKRDFLPEVLDLNNEEYFTSLTDILEMSGRYTPAINPLFSHWADDPVFQLLDTTGATVVGSGTATVTTALTAGSGKYARKTDLVKFPNNKVGYITNVVTSAGIDTLTITSVDGSVLTHTAGQLLSIFSNAVGEASVAPVNRKFGLVQYTNKVQIIRDVNEETDVQMASQVELEWNGSHYIIDKELAQKALMFKAWINGTILGGEMSTTSHQDTSPTLIDPLNGRAVQTSRGLDQTIRSYGIVDTVATPGTFTYADMSDLISQILANKGTKNYLVLRGTKAAMIMDSYFKGITSGISAGKLSLDARSFDMTVDKFTFGNHNFQFGSMGIQDGDMFSQTDINRSIYYIPLDSVKTKGSGMLPRISMKWMPHGVKAGNFGTDMVAEFDTGALARQGATSEEMVRKTHWITHQGLQVLGARHFAKQIVLA